MPDETVRRVLVGLLIVVVVVLVALGLDLFTDDGNDRDRASAPASSTPPRTPTVEDGEWCSHWRALVQVQGEYVASQSPEDAQALLALVERVRGLGFPQSLSPEGHAELTAVLDDLQASADPSFTPTVLPSEPADVPADGDHGHDHEAGDAPFGEFLDEHCPA